MILILGDSGQLAQALRAHLGKSAMTLQRPAFDLANPAAAAAVLRQLLAKHDQIRAVINATAYTAVDLAESQVQDAMTINAIAPGLLASTCREAGRAFVHFSTDYVFDGSGQTPWNEEQAPCPLSAYGRSKFEGEVAVAASGADHLIFRTSWLYAACGKNFVRTMLRLFSRQDHLRVVDDQWGSPTYAPDLARLSLDALNQALRSSAFPSGIYHLTNTGVTNWNAFAREIWATARRRDYAMKIMNPQAIEAIPAADYRTPARRPLNSRLDLSKFISTFGLIPPSWQAGLEACFKLLNPKEFEPSDG